MAIRLFVFDSPYGGRRTMVPLDHWSHLLDYDVLPQRPSFEQYFGLYPYEDDLIPLPVSRRFVYRPRRQESQQMQQVSGNNEVSNTDNEFRVSMDVSHFKPDELTISTVDNRVVVKGKHDEKQDEHGYVEREFKRTYLLPNNVDPDAVKSSLSADGVLSIHAPKMFVEKPREKVVAIENMEKTGHPSLAADAAKS